MVFDKELVYVVLGFDKCLLHKQNNKLISNQLSMFNDEHLTFQYVVHVSTSAWKKDIN